MYKKGDAIFYLENYNNLSQECNEFLLYSFQPAEKSEIGCQKTGRENERNLIKKLDNKQYRENKRILKCIDIFLKSLSPENYRLIYAKYFNRMKNWDIANKYHMSIATVKRKIKSLIDEFLKLLNNF